MLIGAHFRLFLEEFSDDLPQVMERARQAGVSHIHVPDTDSTTIEPILSVRASYPDFCYPMTELHPTSVNESYRQELSIVRERLEAPNNFVAIDEIGLNLYWDRTFLNEQLCVLEKQIKWTLEYKLPIVVYPWEALDYVYKVMEPYRSTALTGTLHSFTGNAEEAARLPEFDGFMLGTNGVAVFRRSSLSDTLLTVPLERIVFKTDSLYLTPAPSRGEKNESANMYDTFLKLVETYRTAPEHLSQATSENAPGVFGMVK